jgi:hypothetical protein
MTTESLHILLGDLHDTRELVFRSAYAGNPLVEAWRAAVSEAHDAYAAWCAAPGRLVHARYLAAEDQADAAVESLRAAAAAGHAPQRLAA